MTLTEHTLLYRADESQWGYVNGGTLFYYHSGNSSKPIRDAFNEWLEVAWGVNQPVKAISSRSGNELVITSHGWQTGDRVVFGQAAEEITGLSSGDYYFVRRVDADTVKVYATKSDAQSDTDVIVLGGSPAGTAEMQRTFADALDLSGPDADAAIISDWLLANLPSLLLRLQVIDNSIWDGLSKTEA